MNHLLLFRFGPFADWLRVARRLAVIPASNHPHI
jgi:hypothetical protein